ncbi:MAG: hypothetical protein WBA59_06070 [Moheibacter sp.]
MKKVIIILLVLVITLIAIVGILKISGFHFAKIGYGRPSPNMEFSKEKGVFIEELYPSQHKLPDNTINIVNVWAERPWSYIDYFQTIKVTEDDVMVIIKCDTIVDSRNSHDNNYANDSILDLYTDYTGKKNYVMYINKGIAIYMPDSIYKNLDTIEIKFPNPKKKLILYKK